MQERVFGKGISGQDLLDDWRPHGSATLHRVVIAVGTCDPRNCDLPSSAPRTKLFTLNYTGADLVVS